MLEAVGGRNVCGGEDLGEENVCEDFFSGDGWEEGREILLKKIGEIMFVKGNIWRN